MRRGEMAAEMLKVSIDPARCVGSGQCVLIAPDVFDQDLDDGHAVLLLDPVPATYDDSVSAAIARCPAQAITTSSKASTV